MTRCARCCLHKSIRIVNLVTNLFGVATIIYALWLQKKWNQGVAEISTTAYLPTPWFIYTCLGLGITVCLSTLFGHIVANCISNSALCIYIVTICSLVLLEAAAVVAIFFRVDWQVLITKYIDSHNYKFKSFVVFHIKMCQLIAIIVLVSQINVIVLALVLWGIGTQAQPRADSNSDLSSIIQSFLESPNMPMPDGSSQTCNICGHLNVGDNKRCILLKTNSNRGSVTRKRKKREGDVRYLMKTSLQLRSYRLFSILYDCCVYVGWFLRKL
ncbi:hypothetical protein Dsin_017649 [Dipteronia sinensis]|uniref:Tetraspanin-19-like n=1 Tax=Dipteronia sinensis TaxID=43782 RepID=A0AAE0AG23_9ROSI|nr:hypothetical protein Dsin_017649 [Dipteronia sinensis]